MASCLTDRIQNAVGRPIPLHLYLKVKEDFDRVHGGRVRGDTTEEPAAPQAGTGPKSMLLCDTFGHRDDDVDDDDTFGLAQRVPGMTM